MNTTDLPRPGRYAPRRFLMLTHDQDIDRRILQQAHSLQQCGWRGAIVCLSHDADDHAACEEGLDIRRIGLAKIVPPCPIYRSYQRRQRAVLQWCYTRPHQAIRGRWPRLMRLVDVGFKNVSRVNERMYHLHLYAYYHNRRLACPLPFDDCFYQKVGDHRADLIVAHDLPALPAGARLAREWDVPLVYDAHELYYEQAAFSRRQKAMMRRVEAELIRHCSATFTVNHSIAQEMARRYGHGMPGVLLNALDSAPSAAGPLDAPGNSAPLRAALQLPSAQHILLFQGGLLANRNLETLARAMAYVQNPNCVLVFMGNGPLRQPLEDIALQTGAGARIRFLPAVPAANLLEWTASADIGLIPYPSVDLNTHFCTPNKLFEYIQAGVPILANDLPELRRYVGATGFGRNAPMHSPRVLAAAIDALLADPAALVVARQALRERRHEFTWTAVSRDYLYTLNNLVPPRQAPTAQEIHDHAAAEL